MRPVRALDATPLRRLSDIHIEADSRRATVCLCFAKPFDETFILVWQVLPVGFQEQLEALTACELVGRLRVSVLRSGGDSQLLAKTHAGSTAERAAWRRSLA